MLSKILNFHRNIKPRIYFFNGPQMPKQVRPEDVARLSGQSKQDELDAQRAKLNETYKPDTDARVDLDSSMVVASTSDLASQNSDQNNGEVSSTAQNNEKGDPLAVIDNAESSLSSPTAQNGEMATQNPESSQVAVNTQDALAELTQQNEALNQELANNAEKSAQLQATISELMSAVQNMQYQIQAQTNTPPKQDMAQEATTNLDSKKAQSIWDKMRKLTPKQIAGGVIAAIGIGVAAVYLAPVALVALQAAGLNAAGTYLAANSGITLGTYALGGLAGAGAMAPVIAGVAGAAGAATAFIGSKMMGFGKKKEVSPQANQNTEIPQNQPARSNVESNEQLKKREKLSDMPDGTVLKTKIRQLDQTNKGYVTKELDMTIKSSADGKKFIEILSADGEPVRGNLYAKTGTGNMESDYSEGVIQENTPHIFYDGQHTSPPFDIITYEKVLPGQAVDQPAAAEPVSESIEPEALEATEEKVDEINQSVDSITPNDDVSDMVVAEKGIEHQVANQNNDRDGLADVSERNEDTIPSNEKIKSHGNIIYIKNSQGKQLEIQTKGLKGNKEIGIIYKQIANHLNLKVDDVHSLCKLTKNSNGAVAGTDRIVTYDLDFTDSGFDFSEVKDGATSETKSDVKEPSAEANPDQKAEDPNIIKLEGKEGSDFITIKGKNGEIVQVPLFYDNSTQMAKTMEKLSEISDVDGTRQRIGPNSDGEYELRPNIRRILENIQIDTSTPKEPIAPPTNEAPKDSFEQTDSNEAKKGDLDTGESVDLPRQPDSEFEAGGAVSVSKIFDKINSTIDKTAKRSDYNELKQKYENQLESINHLKEGDASISLDRFHKIGTISNLYDKLPESIQKLAKAMESSEEFSKQKLDVRLSDPANGVKGVNTEGANKFNRNLSVLLALEKLENTSDEAFKKGKDWFGIDGVANGKTEEGQIAYAMGQEVFEKLKPSDGLRDYVFDQAKIVLENWEKDGNNRGIDLEALKNGDISTLKSLPDLVQQEFGKLMSEVLTGKSIYSQIQKSEN